MAAVPYQPPKVGAGGPAEEATATEQGVQGDDHTMAFEKERDIAIDLARRAGAVVLDLYTQNPEVRFKEKREPVTEADLASNQLIVSGLERAFPDDGILSEEGVDNLSRRTKERVWIVDPLDGTKEFVDRVGQFVVMIGLTVAEEPVLGVVYQPITDRLWWGIVGEGAWEQLGAEPPKRAHVTDRDAETGIRLVVTRSHGFKGVDEIQSQLGISEVKRLGSVGLKVGAIVSGEAELYVHISQYTKEWDACAPHAILRAAGGRMTDLAGAPLRYNKLDVRNLRGLLASNGPVHEKASDVVLPFAKVAGVI